MKNIIFIVALTSQLLFFAFLSILGIEYKGMEESISYALFCTLFAVLSLLVFMKDYLLSRRFLLGFTGVLFFILPIFIVLIFFTEQTSSETAKSFFIFYLLFSLPSTYIGIYIAKTGQLASIAKWFEVLMVILTMSIFPSIILPFLKGLAFLGFAGTSHQTASYTSAFAYSLNLFFILFDNRFVLFRFHYFRSYKILSYTLLLIQIGGVLLSGGRGGFILVVNATLFLLWQKNIEGTHNFRKVLLILIFLSLSALVLLPKLIQSDLFLTSTTRVFSYLSPSGIDMNQTSGRNLVYESATKLIREKPIIGYGLFGYFDYTFYPHNIFLEILLNGGLIYLFFSIVIGLLFLIKFKYINKNEPKNLLAMLIFIYPITELMFSGTYITTPLFWFVLSYVFCYKNPNIGILTEPKKNGILNRS